MGDKPIKGQYPKLFLLVVDNQVFVREMGSWIGGVWYWQLKFRRVLYQWEEANRKELEESLKHIQLKDQEDDRILVESKLGDSGNSKKPIRKLGNRRKKQKVFSEQEEVSRGDRGSSKDSPSVVGKISKFKVPIFNRNNQQMHRRGEG
ncbi:hypothetical protein QQ045_004424 [Rhodiola kirilowii]